ncbi:Lin-15A/B-like domain-containing protein [Caenorhabditis elegans]|nr:Dimer_Tnp_hAT domain-containing protein [Caenorhabditis elegans]CBZ39490.1 Dimer_Tnp_hAT domain-containing protein [Caenorhabditis elegans]|eukprot:NP_001256717.1 Uncharacterized protein CELE_Y32B12B.4 [Caenorhabditis elegans]
MSTDAQKVARSGPEACSSLIKTTKDGRKSARKRSMNSLKSKNVPVVAQSARRAYRKRIKTTTDAKTVAPKKRSSSSMRSESLPAVIQAAPDAPEAHPKRIKTEPLVAPPQEKPSTSEVRDHAPCLKMEIVDRVLEPPADLPSEKIPETAAPRKKLNLNASCCVCKRLFPIKDLNYFRFENDKMIMVLGQALRGNFLDLKKFRTLRAIYACDMHVSQGISEIFKCLQITDHTGIATCFTHSIENMFASLGSPFPEFVQHLTLRQWIPEFRTYFTKFVDKHSHLLER